MRAPAGPAPTTTACFCCAMVCGVESAKEGCAPLSAATRARDGVGALMVDVPRCTVSSGHVEPKVTSSAVIATVRHRCTHQQRQKLQRRAAQRSLLNAEQNCVVLLGWRRPLLAHPTSCSPGLFSIN